MIGKVISLEERKQGIVHMLLGNSNCYRSIENKIIEIKYREKVV